MCEVHTAEFCVCKTEYHNVPEHGQASYGFYLYFPSEKKKKCSHCFHELFFEFCSNKLFLVDYSLSSVVTNCFHG